MGNIKKNVLRPPGWNVKVDWARARRNAMNEEKIISKRCLKYHN